MWVQPTAEPPSILSSLAFNDLSGEIPSGLWDMEKLKLFDLEANSIHGRESIVVRITSDHVDSFVTFLAITYVDRFLSTNINIPVVLRDKGLKENLKLFVFCWVSIACKRHCSVFCCVSLRLWISLRFTICFRTNRELEFVSMERNNQWIN
uniref:Uncharacterized protein n=2 Tax=Lactuca sativa TaxID=4236 RepID=A0A9R1WG17_LACSA|nr:hypothetical protein LSAT_V11C200093500 [Lactuca sativa]KAJ0223448.1 hypothetical protein LSAT_V11C200093510 [Lactuca sativa]